MAERCQESLKMSNLRDLHSGDEGALRIYNIPMKQVVRNEDMCIEKREYGYGKISVVNKVVMMVGATGSGKTTLINSLVNYVFGVEWSDSFRLRMIVEDSHANQAESQTKYVTSYTLHHDDEFQVPYSLTIVDTPGFGDTKGVDRDREIMEQITYFFSNIQDFCITHIDAVGFVCQASLCRLSPSQKYIFDSVLALFGSDLKDNIFLLITFSDTRNPKVLSAVKEAEIPFKKYFLFNNCALYPNMDDEGEDSFHHFDCMFWNMGCKSFRMFLEELLAVETKSLILTKEVLKERKRIQRYVERIQQDIQVKLSTLDNLHTEAKLLEEHERDIDANRDFRYEVEVDYIDLENLAWARSMINCMKCKRTCCKDCRAHFSPTMLLCSAMGWNRKCKVCPSKCSMSDHRSCNFEFVVKRHKVLKTSSEIRRRYEVAQQKKATAKELIDKIQGEIDSLERKILGMAYMVRKSLARLQEIALRPDPLTNIDYIDMMIQNEERQKTAGWKERIRQLYRLREKAEQLENIAAGKTDLFL